MQNISHNVGPGCFLTPEVIAHIETVAKGMLGHANLNESDFEDLCQDFIVRVMQAAEKYDRSKCSRYTWACRIIDWHRNAIYRDRIRTHIDSPCARLEGGEIDGASNNGVFKIARNSVDREMFQLDVQRVIATLPKKYQIFCCCLMEGESMRKAAKTAGIAWGYQINKKVLPFLRKRFECLKK